MISKIIPILVATLIAAAAGGGFGFVMIDQIKQTLEEQKKKNEDSKKLPAYSSNEKLVSLPNILTNLASPEGAWIRMEAKLLAKSGTDNVLAAKIAEDIVAYLRTVDLASLEGAYGFRALKANLKDRVRIRSRGQVKDIVIQEFVIE